MLVQAHLNKDDCSLALEASTEAQTSGFAGPAAATGGCRAKQDTSVIDSIVIHNTAIE